MLALVAAVGGCGGPAVSPPPRLPLRPAVVFAHAHNLAGPSVTAFIRIETPGGQRVREEVLPRIGDVQLSLPPGRYRLSSYRRTCAGSCSAGRLSATEQGSCARLIVLAPGQTVFVHVLVAPAGPCGMLIDPSGAG